MLARGMNKLSIFVDFLLSRHWKTTIMDSVEDHNCCDTNPYLEHNNCCQEKGCRGWKREATLGEFPQSSGTI